MSTKIKRNGSWKTVAKVRHRNVNLQLLKSGAEGHQVYGNVAVQGKVANIRIYSVLVELNQGWNDIAKVNGVKPIGNYQMLNCVHGNTIDNLLCFARASGNNTLISMYCVTAPTDGKHSTIIYGCFTFE